MASTVLFVYFDHLDYYDYLIVTDNELETTYMPNIDEVYDSYAIKGRKLNYLRKDGPHCYVFHSDKDGNKERKLTLLFKSDSKKIPATVIRCDIPYNILEKHNFYKIGRIIYDNSVDVKDVEKSQNHSEISIFKRF